MTDKYLITKEEIDQYDGLDKTHFLNKNAKRNNKSLGDMTGLESLGVHVIEIEPGYQSTELHMHYHEEECVYVLAGTGEAIVGEDNHPIKPGDFLGYRAGGKPHLLRNNGDTTLRCLVVGQRLSHDVGDYPNLGKRIYRNDGMSWNLVDISDISEPVAGAKK